MRQQTVTCERGRGEEDGMGGGRLTDRWKEKQQTDAEEKMADQFGFEKERNSSRRTPRLLIRTYCKEEHIKRLKFESLYVLG